MIFIPNQEDLRFEEEPHKYFFREKELISVSRIIECYKNKFDPDGSITARKAAENGLTIEEQKTAWKKINVESCVRGTAFHNDVENYLKTKKIPETTNKKLVKQFSKIRFDGMLFSEVRLFNESWGVAGTTDLIELLPDNKINLFDFKTNSKGISKFSFGKKMLYPLNHLWDASYYNYEIQMGVYAYMLEEVGWWVNNLALLYIDQKKQEIKEIPMENRRNDVINMLNHYKKNCAHL